MKKAIIITGTPGTGKSILCQKLARKYGFLHLDVNKIIKEKKLRQRYDHKRKTYVVDEKKLSKELIKEIKKSNKTLVIDSHLSHFIPSRYVRLCIVTKTEIGVLFSRLKKRGYNKQKIQENIQSEIFDICLNEAIQRKHKIAVIDTTKKVDISIKI